MNRPWLQFHTRDWLDNKELRRCSPLARAVLADLMCLAHEGLPYGYLSDKVGPLTDQYMASRCVVAMAQFKKAIDELHRHGRITIQDGVRLIPRMVDDESRRLRRVESGSKGGNPNLVNKEVNCEVNLRNPHLVNSEVNLTHNHHGYPPSRARARADSDSESSYSFSSEKTPEFSLPQMALDIREVWFCEFWERYWRKVAKRAAWKAFKRIVTSEALWIRVRDAEIDQSDEQLGRDPDKRPHAATWLNGGYWENEQDPPKVEHNSLDAMVSRILEEK